jgi:hypothetical protein
MANAMTMELKSIVDYNVSLAALFRAQGRGLELERGALPEDNPGKTAFEK